MRQGSGDVEFSGADEDDGGLYDGLQGDERGDGVEGEHAARSRSGTPAAESAGLGEGAGDGEHLYYDADDANHGVEGGVEGEGEGFEHDSFRGQGDDIEQLDFEDTEFTGMYEDDADGAVERGQAGSGSEGHMQDGDGYGGDHVHDHAGGDGDDSMGQQQQQGTQDDGAYADGDQQQQDEQQQDEQQQDEQQQQRDVQQGEAGDEPETGEYRTDDYAEYQDDSGASADEVGG
jgi:hypothetical protein